MTPDQISHLWELDTIDRDLLVTDFINGTYFYLTYIYPSSSLNDYSYASNTFITTSFTLDDAAAIGQTLPTYLAFKLNYPEYFL